MLHFRKSFLDVLLIVVAMGGSLSLVSTPALAEQVGTPAAAHAHGLKNEQELRKQHQKEFLREHSDATGKPRPDLWSKGIKRQKQMQVAPYLGAKPPAPVGQPKTAAGQQPKKDH